MIHNCKCRLPCLKEIPLQREMSRSDKRVAVPARKVGFIRKNKTRRDIYNETVGVVLSIIHSIYNLKSTNKFIKFYIFESLSHGKPCQLPLGQGSLWLATNSNLYQFLNPIYSCYQNVLLLHTSLLKRQNIVKYYIYFKFGVYNA